MGKDRIRGGQAIGRLDPLKIGAYAATMYTIAALYHFTRFDNPAALQAPLLDVAQREGISGSLLLAQEGINGTIAGSRAGIRQNEGAAKERDRDHGCAGRGPARLGWALRDARGLERPDQPG